MASSVSVSVYSLLLLLGALLAVVSGQSYNPYPYPQLSCPSGQTLFSLGDNNIADFNFGFAAPLSVPYVQLMPLNNTAIGGVLSQLSLGLGDNSASLLPVHLRLGLYLLSQTGNSKQATLIGQTDQITLWPSPAQVLYANLLTPVSLLQDQQLALGVSADSPVLIGQQYGAGLQGTQYYEYVELSMPTTLAYLSTGGGPAVAASGCITPGFLSSAASKVFNLCAYMETYSLPAPPLASLNPATSLYTQLTATVVVSTASPTTSSFGTGYTVTALYGQLTQTLSSPYYSFPDPSPVSVVVTLGGSKITSVTPSNLLYLSGSGAAAMVDGNGLSLLTSSGLQVVLQWSASSSQYQTVNSSNNGAPPSPAILFSGGSLVQVTTQSELAGTLPVCAPPPSYKPDVTPACPAGTVSVSYGDVTTTFVASSSEFGDATSANYILFRTVTINSAVSVSSLQYLMLKNPGIVLHMRLGLFNLSGNSGAPLYSLLAQSNPLTLANPTDGIVNANLPSAVSLLAGTYAVGVWFDQPVYSTYTQWAYGTTFSAQLSFLTVDSQGTFPSSITAQPEYQVPSVGLVGCAASTATVQFALCATFTYASTYSTYYNQYSAVVTALANKQSNGFGSYYPLIAAYGNYSSTNNPSLIYNLGLGGFSQQTNNLLYDPATTPSGQVVDASGIGLIWEVCFNEYGYYGPEIFCSISASVLSAVGVSYSTRYTSQEAIDSASYSSYYSATQAAAVSISYTPYTGGQVVCPLPTSPPPINAVSPPSVATPTCSGITSSQLQLGDGTILDYANNKEGNAVLGNVLYTNSFTAAAGWTISALAVDVLQNLGSVTIQLALYSPSNQLVGQTQPISLLQVIDQQVVASLMSPVTLVSGKYLIALMANASLNIATSAVSTPSMAAAGFVLPTALTSSTTAPAVPLLALGCAVATHAFCSYYQFYTPGASPVSTTYLYEGLLAASPGGSNGFGSYLTLSMLQGHMVVETRLATVTTSTPSNAGVITLALGSSGSIYTASTSGSALDSTGLKISGLNWATTLSYGSNGLTDSAAAAIYGAPVSAVFNFTALSSTGNAVPSCNLFSMPSSQSPPTPAKPSCPAGQSLVSYGDMVGADYVDSAEDIYWNNNGLIITSTFTTGLGAPTMLYQLGVGINKNFNVVTRVSFALYDANENWLGATNEVRLVNSQDEQVVGTLQTPLVLQPNTTYLMAQWTDASMYQSFTFSTYYNPCVFTQYTSGSWPSVLSSPTLEQDSCATVALGAFACTVPVTVTPSSSSGAGGPTVMSVSSSAAAPLSQPPSSSSGSQGAAPPGSQQSSSSSSSGNTLSGGAIAGIVIGCVVGTNLLLLVCLIGLCGLRPQDKRAGEKANTTNQADPASRNTQSRVEMIGREQ